MMHFVTASDEFSLDIRVICKVTLSFTLSLGPWLSPVSHNICKEVVVEALRTKERQDETQFTTKIAGKTSLGPSYFVFLQNFHLQLRVDALLIFHMISCLTNRKLHWVLLC
jgi:hypothetical protein